MKEINEEKVLSVFPKTAQDSRKTAAKEVRATASDVSTLAGRKENAIEQHMIAEWKKLIDSIGEILTAEKEAIIDYEHRMKKLAKPTNTQVSATLNIEMNVYCPNCSTSINLLKESETNGYDHNECGHLLRQMFPQDGDHEDYTCNNVTCTECKATFDVKGLEW